MTDSPCAIVFLSILLLLHPTLILSNNFLAPIFDEVCKEIGCGKGNCVSSQNSTFNYECKCDPGWKQSRGEHDDHLKFLPCVIPNCSINRECTATPAPAPEKASKTNASILDPCHWADCGGGSCNKTSTFTYSCICAEGFNNLLNATAFPCYKECSIGMDCSTLGISVSNSSTSLPPPPPALSDNAGLKLIGDFRWLIILLMSLVALN